MNGYIITRKFDNVSLTVDFFFEEEDANKKIIELLEYNYVNYKGNSDIYLQWLKINNHDGNINDMECVNIKEISNNILTKNKKIYDFSGTYYIVTEAVFGIDK